jgi:hypothetical protein
VDPDAHGSLLSPGNGVVSIAPRGARAGAAR